MLTFFTLATDSHSQIGAYLEIDLGQDYDVESVIIFNRPDYQDRLSDTTVTLRSRNDEVLAIYDISDASSLSTVDIHASDFDPFNRCGEIDVCINRCNDVYSSDLRIVDPNDIPALKQFTWPGHYTTEVARGGYCARACVGGSGGGANLANLGTKTDAAGSDFRIVFYNSWLCGAPDAYSTCMDDVCTSDYGDKREYCREGCEFWRRTEFDPFSSSFSLPTPEGGDTSFDVRGGSFGTSDFRIAMDLTGMGRSISGVRDYGVSLNQNPASLTVPF